MHSTCLLDKKHFMSGELIREVICIIQSNTVTRWGKIDIDVFQI